MIHSEDDTNIEVKNLSDETRRLLAELKRIPVKQIELAKRLYESLCKDGLSPMDARKMIEDEVQLSYRTLMRALPQEAKQEQHHVKSRPRQKVDKWQPSNGSLVVMDEQPRISTPSEPTGEIVRIEMDWGHCNFFVNWFRNELKSHEKDKKGKYIIEYDLLTKEISVDMEEN